MIDGTAREDVDSGDHDDLSVFDFSGAAEPESSFGDVFDGYVDYDCRDYPEYSDHPEYRDCGDELDPPTALVVSNPSDTVAVTAFIDGRVEQVELSPQVASMDEADLADEILVIAKLATENARAAQYVSILEEMTDQGHDQVATQDFLSRELGLPSPAAAEAARAAVFATRYEVEND